MNLYGLKVTQVVGMVVDHFGWRVVADEIMANKDRRDRAEVEKLNEAILNFGQAVGAPLVAKLSI